MVSWILIGLAIILIVLLIASRSTLLPSRSPVELRIGEGRGIIRRSRRY